MSDGPRWWWSMNRRAAYIAEQSRLANEAVENAYRIKVAAAQKAKEEQKIRYAREESINRLKESQSIEMQMVMRGNAKRRAASNGLNSYDHTNDISNPANPLNPFSPLNMMNPLNPLSPLYPTDPAPSVNDCPPAPSATSSSSSSSCNTGSSSSSSYDSGSSSSSSSYDSGSSSSSFSSDSSSSF